MRHFFVIGICLCLGACINPPDYGAVPVIEYKSISKQNVSEGQDTLIITFSFTDGDGDLGPASQMDTMLNIFLTDSRDQSVKTYQMPNLTPPGNVKAISGDIAITISPFTCMAGVAQDQLSYTIKVKDRAGNLSNSIQTEQIFIQCQ